MARLIVFMDRTAESLQAVSFSFLAILVALHVFSGCSNSPTSHVKSPAIDELIRRLSAEEIEVRGKAAADLVSAWNSWDQEDLDRLRRHAESGSDDSTHQAKSILVTIEHYRSIPEELWRAIPSIGPLIARSKPDELGNMLRELEKRWDQGELSSKSISAVAINLIEDERKTEIPTEGRYVNGSYDTFTVETLANVLLLKCLYFVPVTSPAVDKRAWWKANKDKPEKEWHLKALESEDERCRGEAIARLAKLKAGAAGAAQTGSQAPDQPGK